MMKTETCCWPKGCVALVARDGLCAAHLKTCARCECPESWHPVVQMADLGPELVCGSFVSAVVPAGADDDVREARLLMGPSLEGRS